MELSLSRSEIFRVDGDARGVAVKCNQGALWVTQPGDHRDHVLNRKERFTVTSKGLIAIVALADTLFEVIDVKNAPNPSSFNLSLGQNFSWFFKIWFFKIWSFKFWPVKIWWDYDSRSNDTFSGEDSMGWFRDRRKRYGKLNC